MLFRMAFFVFVIFLSRLSFAAPVVTGVTPATGIQGATIDLTVTGEALSASATQVRFSDPRIVVNGVRVISATSMVANVTLLAPAGAYSMSIQNGDESNATEFEIVASPLSHPENAVVDHFVGPLSFVGTRDGVGTEARFSSPSGIWSDGTHVYVSDGRIRRISIETAEVTTPESRLNTPYMSSGVLWGDGTYLYTLEYCAIQRTEIATGESTTLAGVTGDCKVVDGPRDVARFNGNRELISGDGSFLYVINGPFSRGPGGSSGIGQPMLPGFIRVVSLATGDVSSIPLSGGGPSSLWSTGQYLYTFGDSLPGKLSIGRIDLETHQHESLFNSSPGSDPTSCCPALFRPGGPWFDGDESFYFLEGLTVRRFDLSTGQLSSVAILPRAVSNHPYSLWGVGEDLYVTDAGAHSVFRVHIPTGATTLFAGRYVPAGPQPMNIAVEWNDSQFLYGIFREAIYKVRIADGEITHIAGVPGVSEFVDGPGPQARFEDPAAIWGDGTYLYVLEEWDRPAIRRIHLATNEVSTLTHLQPLLGGASTYRDLWGSGSYLYVTDILSNSIHRISIETKEIVRIAGSGVRWTHGYVDGIGTEARFRQLGAIWGDDSRLYLRDGCAVREFIIETAEVKTVAGHPAFCELVDGSRDVARFNTVNSIWGNGELLFVLEAFVIRTIDLATGETKTISGQHNVRGSEEGIAVDARFFDARRLTGDGASLYIYDGRIRKLSVPSAIQPYELLDWGADHWTAASVDSMTIGYGRVQAESGSSPADGVAIYSYRQNGVLVSEAAVPASKLTLAGRVYADMNENVNTGIAIANPNDQPSAISFYFTDAEGTEIHSGGFTLEPRHQIAAFLNDALLGGNANARSFTFTSSLPVGAVALRGYVNERSEFLMTTLPIAEIDTWSMDAVVLPHFADGGGWRTQVLLINPTDSPIRGTMEMVGTHSYSIAARSSARIVTANSQGPLRTGSVRINPEPGNVAPVASVVFSYTTGGVTVTESGAGPTGVATSFRLFAEYGAMRTGVAVANTVSVPATVNFELLGLHGQPTGHRGLLRLAANGHQSLFIEQIPGLENLPATFRGVLRVSSDAPVSVLGLRGRYNERGDFLIATTPVLADTAPGVSSGERIFPHIATGGGYTTSFLLLSPGASAQGQILLHTQSGELLPLPVSR